MSVRSSPVCCIHYLYSLTLGLVDTGANASAEEADEGVDDEAVKVNNIVHSFRLQPTSFDKASYGSYLKGGSFMAMCDKHGLRKSRLHEEGSCAPQGQGRP